MQPTDFLLLALAGAVLAIGVARARGRAVRTFDDALLADVKRAIAAQGCTVASYQHARKGSALLTTSIGVHISDRAVATFAPSRKGVSASVVVHGMKLPPATLRIGRDRGRLARNGIIPSGNAAFDGRHVVHGSPEDAVRALLASAVVRGAVAALFALPPVGELRVLALGDQGGALRVELELPRHELHAMRPLADLALALANALDAASR